MMMVTYQQTWRPSLLLSLYIYIYYIILYYITLHYIILYYIIFIYLIFYTYYIYKACQHGVYSIIQWKLPHFFHHQRDTLQTCRARPCVYIHKALSFPGNVVVWGAVVSRKRCRLGRCRFKATLSFAALSCGLGAVLWGAVVCF